MRLSTFLCLRYDIYIINCMCSRPISLNIERIFAVFGQSIGQAKYKQDESNVSTCPYSYPFNEKFIVHVTYDFKWPVHQAVQYHCMDIGRFSILELLHSDGCIVILSMW